jgi:excisionase family DNA binding protein
MFSNQEKKKVITAESVYKDLLKMPVTEREKLFVTIARRGFEKDFYKHDEVFDDIRQSPFSLKEAAEYLEVADITVRRWVKEDKLSYKKIGRNLVFDPDDLKAAKKKKLKKLQSFDSLKSSSSDQLTP